MALLSTNTPLDVLKHMALIAACGLLLVLGFFYVYLPITTHHGETITVPKVTGMNLADLEQYLDERNLQYFVDDSSYSAGTRPFTVLTQDPAPGEKVKEDRKIYLPGGHEKPARHQNAQAHGRLGEECPAHSQELRLAGGPNPTRARPRPKRSAEAAREGREIAPGAPIAKAAWWTWWWATARATRNLPCPTS